jgi:hypothetical protein
MRTVTSALAAGVRPAQPALSTPSIRPSSASCRPVVARRTQRHSPPPAGRTRRCPAGLAAVRRRCWGRWSPRSAHRGGELRGLGPRSRAEVGKPLAECQGRGRQEIVDTCDFFLGEGAPALWRNRAQRNAGQAAVHRSGFRWVCCRDHRGQLPGGGAIVVPGAGTAVWQRVVWKPAEYAAGRAQQCTNFSPRLGCPMASCSGSRRWSVHFRRSGQRAGRARVDKVGLHGVHCGR